MEREQASKFLQDLLRLMHSRNGSDLFLTAEFPPAFKIDGKLVPVSSVPLAATHTAELARALMNDRQAAEFEEHKEVNFAISPTGIGRFRVNVFRDNRGVGAVLRQIPSKILTFEQLSLPPVLKAFCDMPKGLVLVTGPTGSGKSTTLAAMVDYINKSRADHIITMEDPIEFVHQNHKCLLNQREIGGHTTSFSRALRAC